MSALLFGPRAPLPQSDHRVPTHGMPEQPGLQQDLAAVMAVVREVVDEEARPVVGEPHDAATRRDRRRYDAQDGLTLCAEGPNRLCPSDAQSVQLAWDVSRGIGADEVAQTAVVQVRHEGSDRTQPVTPSAPEFGAPHGGIEALDEVLIYASAR